jgi:hypothetical protein
MKTKKKKKKKRIQIDKKICPSGEHHEFEIIHGSGKSTGTPRWKCKKCPKTIKAS